MKTHAQNKFFTRIFVAILFLSTSIPSFGQEYIRSAINDNICDTSIVRGVAMDTVLIYNKRYTPTDNVSSFSFMVANNPNMWTLYINPLYVNDFEVFDRRIFFCGYIRENGMKAIIGYFKLDDYPNIDLFYYRLDNFRELRKLDVYKKGEFQGYERTHVVATGTSAGIRSDVLVDMTMDAPGTSNCGVLISTDENEDYDDVATTKSRVVVSSRNKVQGIPVENFWYYKQPLYTGQNIFSSNPDRFRISSPVADSPVLLEYTTLDSFVAVYKIKGFSKMAMLRMDVTALDYQIFEIVGDKAETVYPIDIKRHARNSVYDILAYNKNWINSQYYPMQIYHVVPGDLSGVTPYGQGTNYTNFKNKLWSLDMWPGLNNFFIVSGDLNQYPRLFRFKHYQWENCTNRFEYYYSLGKLEGEFIDVTISPYENQLDRIYFQTGKGWVQFPVRCGNE